MTDKFEVKAAEFDGPLEALLDMIETRKLSITEVSLAQVCDGYLVYIEKLPELPLGETAQFILVASTLLLIKSRTLLPTLELSDEERESVQELERRLARLALIRKAAKFLRKAWGEKPLILPKAAPVRPAVFNAGEAQKDSIYAAAKRLLATIPSPERMVEAAVAPVLALEDVIKNVHARISQGIRARFSELTKTATRQETIVYFLAMLELVRSGSASVTQGKLFSDIEIELESSGVPQYGV